MKTQSKWIKSISAFLLIGVMAACAPAASNSAAAVAATSVSTASAAIVAASPTAVAESTIAVTADSTTTLAASIVSEAAAGNRINLNTASEANFLTIPSVGSRMVREFMEYRPYTSILQFEKEIGKYVDAAQVQAYEQYVYVPISINDSDATTLMQISGLDASEAEALVAARPYASSEAFLTALANVVSAEELASAQNMLGS